MTQDPRSRQDSPPATPNRARIQIFETASSRHTIQQGVGVKDISRLLAAHGAGATSIELAFDLVLHEIVVETAETIHATGAAILWQREGEMVCRAATGTGAPELGASVDLELELASACLKNGQVQICRDAHSDSRFMMGTRRPLEARSMLFAP